MRRIPLSLQSQTPSLVNSTATGSPGSWLHQSGGPPSRLDRHLAILTSGREFTILKHISLQTALLQPAFHRCLSARPLARFLCMIARGGSVVPIRRRCRHARRLRCKEEVSHLALSLVRRMTARGGLEVSVRRRRRHVYTPMLLRMIARGRVSVTLCRRCRHTRRHSHATVL